VDSVVISSSRSIHRNVRRFLFRACIADIFGGDGGAWLPVLMLFPCVRATAPWRQIKIDVSICLFILPPIYLSIYLSICIYLHLSVDPRGYPFSDASFRRETERDASYAAQKFHF
jgi:hypothetical protein